MYLRFTTNLLSALVLSATAMAGDDHVSKAIKETVPPEEDRWKFMLAAPGFMAGVEGTVGINGVDSDIDLGFDDLFNKIDMAWATRAEASKGRFGILGELIYLSLSDSLGVGGPVQKVDVRLDEYLADFALRWRLVEGERGFVDAIVGVRYTNLYQHLHVQSDDAGIGAASAGVVDKLSGVIRDRLNEVLSKGEFRNALVATLESDLSAELNETLGSDPRRETLPIGPLAGLHSAQVASRIEEMVAEEEAQLRKEISALRLQGAARAAEVRRRVDGAKDRLEKKVAKALEKDLNRSFSRGDDWWDPYVGVRARYNFTPAIYLIGRADIGGFGVGSDLMWQAEGALGFQVTRSVFAEVGYRALAFDYDRGGLTYDTTTHGAQVTVGIEF